MCGGGGSGPDYGAQAQLQQQQIAAQQDMAAQSLAQSKAIADEQARQNQEAMDYSREQDARSLADSQQQAARQITWDASRNQRAQFATRSIDDAFSKFTPDYFKDYRDAQYGAANSEIERQYGLAQKGMSFGLARAGQLAGTNAADQEGQLIETRGRAQTDQMNKASDAATQLQQSVATAHNSLLGQALSSDVLGSPIASGNDASVTANIDTANRALIGVSDNARNFTTSVQPTHPSLGTLSGIFTGALTGVANAYSGAQDAKIANGAYGGANVSPTGLFGSGSVRTY